MYQKFFKRLIDIFIALLAMPFVGLSILIFGPMIYFEDRGTIFYKAKRRGLNGCIFEMYKFRSMKMNAPDYRNADNSTYVSANDDRITKIGRFLRKTSIDELPQFINVLKGDMSLIGPRPVTTDKPLSEYDEKRLVRLTVKPGITGYSQAYFRRSISQEETLEKDAVYARNVSFIGDVKIFCKTVQTVLLQRNVYQS